MHERGEIEPIVVPAPVQHDASPEVEISVSRRDGMRALGALLVQASLPAAVVSHHAAPIAHEAVAKPLTDIPQAVKAARTTVDVVDNLPAFLERDVPRRAFLPFVGKVALGKIPSAISKIDRFASWAARTTLPGTK